MKGQPLQQELFSLLERTDHPGSFSQYFYNYCLNANALQIKKCFMKKHIAEQIGYDTIGHGLVAFAETNNFENASLLLDLFVKNNPNNTNIRTNLMINVAMSLNHFEFLDKMFEKNKWGNMLDDYRDYCLMSIEKENPLDGISSGGICYLGLTPLQIKYEGYSKNPLDFCLEKKLDLEYLLKKPIGINNLKDLVFKAFHKQNIDTIIKVFKSPHADLLVKNEVFNQFMNSDRNTEFKAEMRNILNSIQLKKELDENLKDKSTHFSKMKI